MTDPKKIDSVIEVIANVWKKYPNLRLGQLLSNAVHIGMDNDLIDLFYIEDDKLIEMIRKFDKSIVRNKI